MLGIGRLKTKTKTLLAVNTQGNVPVYFVPNEDYPQQKINGSPLRLVDPESLLKIFKKYSLKKSEISLLVDFYENSDSEVLELEEGSVKLKMAFQKLEQLMLDALKNVFYDPSAKMQVYHDPKLFLGAAFIGPSHSGKTYAAGDILLRPEFEKTKLYVFTQNPTDPSILRLKTRGRYTVFVDLNKITSDLNLVDSVSPSSICLFDDIFELPRTTNANGYSLRKNLINLMNQILVRGRHHKKNKHAPGTSAIICAHMFKNAHDSKVLWNEAQGGIYIFPSSSPHKSKDFLKSIGIHRVDLDRIFDFARDSRWICFKISQRPVHAIYENGVYLL